MEIIIFVSACLALTPRVTSHGHEVCLPGRSELLLTACGYADVQPSMTLSGPSSSNPGRASEHPCQPCAHRARRLFVGPLPDKLLPVMHEIIQVTGNDNESLDASYASAVRDVLDRNAHAFFLRQGGKAEDWDDGTRNVVRDDLMKQWQECPWMRSLRRTTHRATGVTHWVGTTFEVGSILGVNVLDSHARTVSPPSESVVAPEAPQQESQVPYASTTALSSIGPRSYWTARSHLSPPSPQGSSSTASLPEQRGGELSAFSSGSRLLAMASAPSFPIEHVSQQGNDAPRSILKQPARTSSGWPGTKRRGVSLVDRGAKRTVQLRPKKSKTPLSGADSSGLPLEGEQANEGPVSPSAVLARTGNEVNECSAGATAEGTPPQEVPDDILFRGLWGLFNIRVTPLIVSKIECLLGCVTPSPNPLQTISTRFKTARRPTCVMKTAWSSWWCGERIC